MAILILTSRVDAAKSRNTGILYEHPEQA